jgi:microcystin-dependent protein
MPFIGEIQLFGIGFAPPDWTPCNGAQLKIKDFSKLFSLIGTTYGGDGRDQFRLPNLTGRAACGQGQGVGLSPRKLGDTFGVNQVALEAAHGPAHGHGLSFFNVIETAGQPDKKTDTPKDGYSLATPENAKIFFKGTPEAKMLNTIGTLEGGTEMHENRQPFEALEYYILADSHSGEMPSFG